MRKIKILSVTIITLLIAVCASTAYAVSDTDTASGDLLRVAIPILASDEDMETDSAYIG